MFMRRNKSESIDYLKEYHKYAETHVRQKLNNVNIVPYYTISSSPSDLHDVFKVNTVQSKNG